MSDQHNTLQNANLGEIVGAQMQSQQVGNVNQQLDRPPLTETGAPQTQPTFSPDQMAQAVETLRPPLYANEEVPTPTGLVIEKKPEVEKKPSDPNINPELDANIANYLNEMDSDIHEQVKINEQFKEIVQKEEELEDEEEEAKTPEEREDDFNQKYQEAIVVIDKLGMGKVNFTEEERAKLEVVKKIKVEEVETVKLRTVKKKRAKKDSLDKILKRQPSLASHIVNPASGYTAALKGCSTYELMTLSGGGEDPLREMENKWSLIYSKIQEASIKFESFNDFLKSTAASDYSMFIYGLLCATYPDTDKIPLKCPNCQTQFEHEYDTRSLIRAEGMSDRMKELVASIIDNSHTEETARRIHEGSVVRQVKEIELPLSGYILEVYVQSAYDLIYNSIKGLSENREEKYNQASILSTIVKAAYIPDPDAEGEYYEYSEPIDVTKIIYELKDTDILTLTRMSEKLLEDVSIEFGLMNVKCPNQKCGDYRESVPFDIESILFFRYQQAMSTVVE